MTGSVALDVVIGLVFIYLLYSLFATTIMEMINSFLGLRARNLRYALRRMLMDEKEFSSNNNLKKKFFRLIINHLLKITGKAYNLMKPDLFNDFYKQPSIKYLGGGGLWNKPAYITSQNFSKALIDSLKDLGDDGLDNPIEKIKSGIKKVGIDRSNDQAILAYKNPKNKKWIQKTSVETKHFIRKQLNLDIEHESSTKKHLVSLMEDANNDLQKFEYLLQQWFDDTMERSTGWFKRRVQYFLFFIGFILAISFNADTLSIIKKLSNDTKAREQLVAHASNYGKDNENLIKKINSLQTNPTSNPGKDSLKTQSIKEVIKSNNDSLHKISQTLQKDIVRAQNIIASNWRIPDRILNNPVKDIPKDFTKHGYKLVVWDIMRGRDNKKKVKKDTVDVSILVHKSIDKALFEKSIRPTSRADFNKGIIDVNKRNYKWSYVFKSKGFRFMHLWGYVLTALAISLGSPFWFDLLNRLIKLRSSLKPKEQQKSNATLKPNEDVNIMHRVG
ncbi:hypothetical protein Q4Q34_15730 [Flavivirga abyssicola]|uniref:hypothetical protein n=1 Tax=Flavivirga abyssicola TaxID=3063533 RepID=UPI0026DEF68D|nr:hypothetical protein [Flavivirga sp. MEBiC07777]WVK12667.1 hypothetical protein Q4Q34_15730 [Flavivirga sp. MEBiC07777]